MKKNLLFLLALFVLYPAVQADAQGWRRPRLPKKINAAKISLPKPPHIPTVKITTAVQKTAAGLPPKIAELTQRAPQMVPDLNAPIRQSVLPIQEGLPSVFGEKPFIASAFIIEEEFEGQKHLWGVTAAHIAALINPQPVILLENQSLPFPIEFVAMGSSGMADLALFPAEEIKELVTPLKLAKNTPRVNEKTFSFGFFDNNFFLVPNRTVLENTPNRMVTSLNFQTKERAGACGGPVLNKDGEVTGVHVGSSDSKGTSFVVPASEITRLLKAYRNNGKDLKPLVFNGTKIGYININENIEKVRAFTGGHASGEFTALHKEKEIDYAHLETLLLKRNPDELHIFISHKPFSLNGEDSSLFFIRLTYDVKRGKVSYDAVDAIPY